MRQLQPIPNRDNDSGTDSSVDSGVGLAARLRPPFAQPVILVDPDDPVIGGPRCLVPVCDRLAVIYGKCSAHHQRWIDDGRPDDVQAWAQAAPANRRWLQQQRSTATRIRDIATRASDDSLRQRLALAHDRINQLRAENHQLRDALAHAHGQLRATRLGETTHPVTTEPDLPRS